MRPSQTIKTMKALVSKESRGDLKDLLEKLPANMRQAFIKNLIAHMPERTEQERAFKAALLLSDDPPNIETLNEAYRSVIEYQIKKSLEQRRYGCKELLWMYGQPGLIT